MINRTGLTAIFITTKSDRNLANRYVHWLGNSMFKLVDGVSQTLLLINCILQINSLKRSHTIAEKKPQTNHILSQKSSKRSHTATKMLKKITLSQKRLNKNHILFPKNSKRSHTTTKSSKRSQTTTKRIQI